MQQAISEPSGDGSPAADVPAPPGRPTRRSAYVLGAALGLGLLADVLFYGERLGISVPLFAAALVAGLLGLARSTDVRPRRANLWLLAPVAFFAAMVPLRADPILIGLNLACVLVALGLLAAFFVDGRPGRQRLGALVRAPFLAFGYALVRPARLLADVRRDDGAGRPRRLVPVLRGLLIALPLLVGFGFLLASADLVFEQFMKDLLNFKIPPALQELFWQALVAFAVAWIVAGAYAYALAPKGAEILPAAPRPLFSLGYVEAATVVAAVNAMLLLFGWVQFTYLFGGQDALAAEGLSYAEYARRGFFELVAVAFVSLLLLLALHRVTRFEGARQERRFGLLTTLTVGLVLVLLASAFYRLRLYEAAYGYTRLRLYAHAFVVGLGAVLLWLPLTRWMRRLRPAWPLSFGFGTLMAALLFTASLDVLNPDAFIARRNVERFEKTGKLDVRYLTWLSDEAVPAMADVLPRLEGRGRSLLLEDLQRRQARLERRQAVTGWPSWHASRARALRTIPSPVAPTEE